MASYICKYGHKHRTETGVLYCHVNVPWQKKFDLLKTTHWQQSGTTEVWSDLGRFRDLFWQLTRSAILSRDVHCQYEGCLNTNDLEVHHIVPRRLGGTDHPANLIALCHDHHRIQPCHHHRYGLVIRDSDIPITSFPTNKPPKQIHKDQATLSQFGV